VTAQKLSRLFALSLAIWVVSYLPEWTKSAQGDDSFSDPFSCSDKGRS